MTPMATEGTRNNKDEGSVPVLSDSIPLYVPFHLFFAT